jgi:aldehyde dehydrogenase (NAD+)
MPNVELLHNMRSHFETGVTQSYLFRKKQLQLLKEVVLKYEKEISDALFADLKKSPEEAYSTEIGLVLSELSLAIKKLQAWMSPKRVSTDLANLPSSSKIYRDALGVVLIISPWNYPFQLMMNPLIGAIAGGNVAVIKPSEFATATAIIIEKIIKEIYPSEYVHVVQGDGATVVPAMMQSFRFDHVFYTGSIPVGKAIYKMAAEKLIPVTLELGGKSPCVVEADANLTTAAKRIVLGKFLNVGQTCIAPDYILVHQSVKEELVVKLKSTIEKFYTVDASASYDYGKIINEKRFEKLISYLNDGHILYGGNHDEKNLFIAPTLMDEVSMNSAVMQEEIFGPILPIITYTTTEEAMQIVKKNENPLAFYLFTSDKKTEQQWINAVPFGGGCINNADWHFTNHNLPFGGVGNSGLGAYHGKFSFETFTRAKSVLKTPNWWDPYIKYPSFKGRLKLFKWIFR